MKKLLLSCVLVFSVMLIPAQDLEITQLTNYLAGNHHIVGILRNNGSAGVRHVSVSVAGYDEDGVMMLSDWTYVGSPIPAGADIPFMFMTTEEDAKGLKSYTVFVEDYSLGVKGSFAFDIGDIRITEQNAAFHEYSGVITNATGEPRKYVQLHFMGFNDDGDLVYYDQTYAKSTTMRDGAQSLFAFLVPPERSALISTYRCYAHAD